MPKIAEIDDTPNPNAVKFTLHEPLTWGISHSYENAEQARDDALAAALFAIPHVSNVFYVDRRLTVTQDGDADWPALVRLIAVPHVVGLAGNYLSIHYQGACGSCPSSISGTLSAIENLVRTIEPDLAVVAV